MNVMSWTLASHEVRGGWTEKSVAKVVKFFNSQVKFAIGCNSGAARAS
jgi:hypothetical protein